MGNFRSAITIIFDPFDQKCFLQPSCEKEASTKNWLLQFITVSFGQDPMNGEQIGIGNLTKLGHPDGWNRESILGLFRMIEGG